MTEPTRETGPIWTRCEGSGCPPIGASWMCSMCGMIPGFGADGRVPEHNRDDIFARIVRGDFGD